MSPQDMVEAMTQVMLSRLPTYRTKTGDVRAVCASRLFVGLTPSGGNYDADLVRIFGGFKNEDGSVRTTYDPDVVAQLTIAPLSLAGFGVANTTIPKDWRGRAIA